MVTQLRLDGADRIPSTELDDWGAVPEPIGEPVSRLRGRMLWESADGSEAGLWECTPGKWVRQIMNPELATFLSGHAIFSPEGGQPFHIRAGDVVYFPANSRGTWEIVETTRKSFMILPPAGD
jgi:hypothetical protein